MIVKRIFTAVKNFLKYIRTGGVVYVNVAQINYGGILKDRKAIITGGSSGIGYAIAKKFINEGAEVIITGRNLEKLKKAQASINHTNCKILQWDIAETKCSEEKLNKAIEILGKVDIFINNAGVFSNKDLFDITEKDWDSIFNINSRGLYFASKAVIKYYLQNNIKGKIINISSNRGILGDFGPYGASKWGVIGLTKGLGRDLFAKGIIINAIAPGMTATNINNVNVNENAYSSETLNGKICLPEEIAELATFLASDAANHIVGQNIVCDGGTSLN